MRLARIQIYHKLDTNFDDEVPRVGTIYRIAQNKNR